MEQYPPTPGQPASYVQPQVIHEQAAPRKKSGWGRVAMFLILVVLLVSLVMNLALMALVPADLLSSGESTVREKYHSLNRFGREKVAILSIEGAIYEAEDGFVKRQIDQVLKDESVKAVVLRVDSPGGTVTASDYLLHHLKQMVGERDIPLVVSMGGICASGGYYVSMAVGDTPDSIFAEPTTWTGSIGVVIPHYDVSGLMSEWKVADDSIQSAPLKTLGSPTKPMTEAERVVLQGLVDDSFNRFKSIVVDGRPNFKNDAEALARVTTGQVFSADQALAEKLVDRVGFVEAAIDRAIELASLDREKVREVKYTRPPSFGDFLFGASARAPQLDLSALADLSVPRAYYMFTTLPPLVRSAAR